jgi:hypothetical protein
VSVSVKCSVSGEVASYSSHYAAVQSGWRFVTIEIKDRNRHFCFSPKTSIRWLDEALGGDKPKKD